MKRILTVDLGNTALKASLYCGERDAPEMRKVFAGDSPNVGELLDQWRPDGIAICRVGNDPYNIVERLMKSGVPALELTPSTQLPITVEYDTRNTLGNDRVAAAVGATAYADAALVVDAGTAITSDIIAGGCFHGGNISPGLRLRFRSLNAFTSRLPLIGPDGELPEFGHDTVTAIRAGVMGGVAAQIMREYRLAKQIYNNIQLMLTGGDADIIGNMLAAEGADFRICPSLVGLGLVRIFNHNNHNEKN
ncbi:MAG: type III pantothenate kinase [Candidatus Amulumruptor caecigallinarius]|nr:type III pantothenate kinase [Candidatus Amulumruptor caecigallinarius]